MTIMNEDLLSQPVIGVWAVEFKVPRYEATVMLAHPSEPGSPMTLARCSTLAEAEAIVEQLKRALPNTASLPDFIRLCSR